MQFSYSNIAIEELFKKVYLKGPKSGENITWEIEA